MLYFDEATLKYAGQTYADNGSPTEVYLTKRIQVKEIKAFSLNYYLMGSQNQRIMRKSKNFVVPRWVVNDIVKDGTRYQLLYLTYNNVEYAVKQVLRYFKMENRVILDCEELR